MGHFDEDYNFSVNPNIINDVDGTELFNAAINECTRNLDILFSRGADTENEPNVDGLLSLVSDVDTDSTRVPSYTDSESSFSSNSNVEMHPNVEEEEEDSELATSSNETTDSDSVDSSDNIDYITEIEVTIKANNGFRYARFNFLPTRNDD